MEILTRVWLLRITDTHNILVVLYLHHIVIFFKFELQNIVGEIMA